jgi:hypothetical protein
MASLLGQIRVVGAVFIARRKKLSFGEIPDVDQHICDRKI